MPLVSAAHAVRSAALGNPAALTAMLREERAHSLFITQSFLHEPKHRSLTRCPTRHCQPHTRRFDSGAFYAVDVLLRGDRDYGTAGTLLIPGKRLGICNDKNGQVYLLNLDNLGGYQARAEFHQQKQGFGII